MTNARLILLLLGAVLSGCQANSAAAPSMTPQQSTTPAPNVMLEPPITPGPTTTTQPSATPEAAIVITRAQTTGNLEHNALTETSGLAASTRRPNTFWAINDSGNEAKVYAFDATGKSLGSWAMATENRDWEDMASAWINGESYLLIADIGDNLRVKNEHVVHVIAEPIIGGNAGVIEPVHTIRFRYPGAKHNAESLAVSGEWLYILTKEPLANGKRQPSHAYKVPLTLSGPAQTVDATLIAQLAVPASTFESSLIASLSGVDVSQPTAFDIDQQNRVAYVLTYRSVYRYQRNDNQSWADAFALPRELVHSHWLSQAEALAVDDNGVVWFTSEKRPAPLWALPAKPY